MKKPRHIELREFLAGGPQVRRFVRLDPSSFAATFAGKAGGDPTIEDQIKFNRAFPSDAVGRLAPDFYADLLPELAWNRNILETKDNGAVVWEETLDIGGQTKRRVIAKEPGTIPWLVEAAIKGEDDFDLIDYCAQAVQAGATKIADSVAHYPAVLRDADMLPGAVLLTAFEVYWLIDYPDMPLYFMDYPERYIASIQKVHQANLVMLEALANVGFEHFETGSAGLELLSPTIFKEAIVPFQREFNDRARELGVFSSYHICGHSKQLIEMGIFDDIKPTVFETCSTRPCGNNDSLREAVTGISDEIITKGNLALELLREGTVDQITTAVGEIVEAVGDRRHIIGQADATILEGTPHENIHAFLDAALEEIAG